MKQLGQMEGQNLKEEEQVEEQVMSEVHLGCPPGFSRPHISRFTIRIPPDVDPIRSNKLFKDEEVAAEPKICVDEDGDLVVTRRRNVPNHSFDITICHNVTSSIPNVGLQVWRAELALADFVLHKMFTSAEFDGIVSLELGAGTGLVGMLIALVARTVFLTDRGDDILDNCAKNVHLNSGVLNYQGTIHVRELDWMTSWPPTAAVGNSACHKRHTWTPSEFEEVQGASLLLAADVIYSDDLTDALFRTLERLMSLGEEKVLYLALEKRYNFSLDDLGVVANGYSHFRSYLGEEEVNDAEYEELEVSSSICFAGKRIDISVIPQYVREYDRGNDIELWQIKYHGRNAKASDSYGSHCGLHSSSKVDG